MGTHIKLTIATKVRVCNLIPRRAIPPLPPLLRLRLCLPAHPDAPSPANALS